MRWNATLYDDRHGFVAEYGKELLSYIEPGATLRVLDIGCGTGALTAALSERCGTVLGIDASMDMVQKAKAQYPSIEFATIDALALPFEHEWDIVFSNAVFHWIVGHDALLSSIHRALKPGGMLLCEFGAHGNIQTIERAFAKAMQAVGHSYASRFVFQAEQDFRACLVRNGFEADFVHAFDRPTLLSGGEQGLSNWAQQFFATDLAKLKYAEREAVLCQLSEDCKDALWDGQAYVADYRRLRVMAHAR